MYLVYVHWNEIYALLFLCDIFNEVYKHITITKKIMIRS